VVALGQVDSRFVCYGPDAENPVYESRKGIPARGILLEPERAWKKFNQAIGADGSVGVWHETYAVDPDQFESVYANMPRFGLARAVEHVEAVGRRATARKRLEANKTSELATGAG
jgi:hypothetical protein